LLSQHCPRQYELVRAGKLKNEPKELVIANIMAVLDVYSKACLGSDNGPLIVVHSKPGKATI
jgi:tagatose-1,6-bisphosphate aldolase non-catalytic subunit AgaZ/GatZ